MLGQFSLSDEILSEPAFLVRKNAESASGVFDQRLINANLEHQRFDRIVNIWEAEVERNSGDTQARLALSASYLKVGRRTEAIEQIREVIKIEPNFKTQGESLISEILLGNNPI